MNFLQKIFILQIGLMPATIVAGPALAEANLFLLSIISLYVFFKKKDYLIIKQNKNIIILFGCFCLFIILTSIFSDHVLFSLKNSLFYFRFGIYALSIFYVLRIIVSKINIVYNLISITLIVLIVDALIQIYFKQNILGYESEYGVLRISGMFGDEYVLGSFLQKTIPIYLFLTFYTNKKIRFIHLIFISLIYLIIFRTGERSAFFLTTLFLLTLLFTNYYIRKKIIIIFSIFAVLVPIILFENFRFTERYIQIYKQVFDPTKFWEKKFLKDNSYLLLIQKELPDNSKINTYKNTKGFYFFSFHHEMTFNSALKMFKNNPVLGIGVKNFRKNCSKYSDNIYGCSTHPHNTYIQLLSETGIFGFCLVLFLFLSLILEFVKYSRRNVNDTKVRDYWIILNVGIIINLWPFIPTGNFFNNWLCILYFMSIGFYFFAKEKKLIIRS